MARPPTGAAAIYGLNLQNKCPKMRKLRTVGRNRSTWSHRGGEMVGGGQREAVTG